ncbi:hypothetical protein GW750_00135 [bacterium]|nr:hypothetical protein [bacterium]
MLPTKVEQVYKDSLLKVLLSSLSQKNRELIILYYFEQKPYEEIAAIL